jgi:hypothetical protein
MAYPTDIPSFTPISGTTLVATDDHANRHNTEGSAITALATTLGTTAGTSVIKDFSAGDFAERKGKLSFGATTYNLGTAALSTNDVLQYNGTSIVGGASSGATDGWTSDSSTWTYASATTFTVTGDVTTRFTKGTRIKLTQSASVKYFVVTDSSFSSNTTVTITGGSDYTLANAAISATYYSYQQSPQGYPTWFNYSPSYSAFNTMTFTSVSTNIAKFKVDGKTVTLAVAATGTTGGTASNAIYVNVPIIPDNTSVQGYRAPGSVDDGTGLAGFGLYTSGSISMGRYDNGNFGLGAARGIYTVFTYGF